MRRLLIGNFDFEWSLAHPRSAPGSALTRLADELACTWLAIAESDDLLLLPGVTPTERHELLCEADVGLAQSAVEHATDNFGCGLPTTIASLDEAPQDALVTPWGWTRQLLSHCQHLGLAIPEHPPVDVVQRVNSRRFSIALEDRFDSSPSGVRWIESMDQFRDHLKQLVAQISDEARWVLKANLSNSSRERLIGRGHHLSPRDHTWIESRLERDGGLALEPWLDVIAEAGVQFDIAPSGNVELLGVTPQVTDPAGHYRGSLFTTPGNVVDEWRDEVDGALAAAEAVAAEGYFGPLGIDLCRYRNVHGVVRSRPLQDINARWTMGRLSLGWRRLAEPGDTGFWRHGPPGAVLRESPHLPDAPADCILPTSPTRLDDRPTRIQHRLEIWRAAAAGKEGATTETHS
ncbi:MAG: hypothetical protein KDA75_05180 [Planctomycetaceae bacterium]|nr:hypothetical protein [Planctomycetaceae bacterium]